MITKILFTLAVIALVILSVRFRQRRPDTRVTGGAKTSSRLLVKSVALMVVVLMLAAASVVIYLEWQEAREVLVVQVIDSRSGKKTEYRVKRGNLEERAFQALDGRYVRLAETERMEISSH